MILGLLCAAAAILCGGVLKGATGMGAPLVAIPILASFYSVPTAITVMTIPLIASNIWQMWTYRREREGGETLSRMLVGCGIGVAFGTLLLGLLPEAWLAIALAVLVFLFIAFRLARPDMRLAPGRARASALPVGLVAGVLQGAVGISGPLSVSFILAQGLGRRAHVFALSAVFTVMAVTQTLSLSAIGFMTWQLAALSSAALAPMLLGVWIGQQIGGLLSQKVFERLTLAVLALSAAILMLETAPDLRAAGKGAPAAQASVVVGKTVR